MAAKKISSRKKITKTRKIFVIDTSVLLYDKNALTSFPGNDIVVPLIVLDELDHFKDKQGIIGENARFVNRFLDAFRENSESLSEGVKLQNVDSTLRVEINAPAAGAGGLESSVDNRIIALALSIKMKEAPTPVIVVTKDINFRVKCDALHLLAEDYYKDSVPVDSIPGDIKEVIVDDAVINEIFLKKVNVKLSDFGLVIEHHQCEPFIFKSGLGSKSALVTLTDSYADLVGMTFAMNDLVKIKPKNKEQTFALHMLLNPELNLVTLTGIAGSGKTFLALMAGLSGVLNKQFKRIVITRPIQPVGKDLGYLPGDLDDKMAVWIKPITDNFREGIGEGNDKYSDKNSDKGNKDSYFEMMQKNGQIEIAPLPYIRGRTFNDSFIIVDEAQNATIHELKTIITRVGKNSKIVLLGDIDQVDTPYLDTFSNGLTVTVDRFKDQVIAGHVRLPKSERSNLAAIASQIL